MATPPLMSERNELHATTWRDCAYAAAMMLAYKRGYRAWPLGYNYFEREALERSDDQPNEIGASVADIDVATQRRYGFTFDKVTAGDLTALLSSTSTAQGFMLGGYAYTLPTWLRRWSPTFSGGHSVYVEPYGDGKHVRWLDPEATWGFLGDIVDVPTVVKWAAGMTSQRRTAHEGAVKGYSIDVTHAYSPPASWTVRAGTTLSGYSPDHPGSPVLTRYFGYASSAHADADVTINWTGYAVAPIPRGGPFLRVVDGTYKGLYIVKAQVGI